MSNLLTERLQALRDQSIEVHILPEAVLRGIKGAPIGYFGTHWRWHRFLTRLIRRTGARIVHANDAPSFQLAVSAAKRSRIPIAMNLRDTLDPERTAKRARYRLLFGLSDRLFFLSHDMIRRWALVAPNAGRAATVTYSIVDPQRFGPRPPAPAGSPPVVLVSGIVRPKKGQLDFLRHVAPALAAHGTEIWIAGDFDPKGDPYAAACVEAARPLGHQIKFLGFRRDLADLMAQSTVIAIPSRHEGLMRGMIEAMSCARPIVSFDVCSAREVLEERSRGAGVVVEQGDFASMSAAILDYCQNPEAAVAAGRAGAETARRLFDPDEVVERYENQFRAMVA